jgi:hypothetical protein
MLAMFMFTLGRKLIVSAARREEFDAHYGWGGSAWTGKGRGWA